MRGSRMPYSLPSAPVCQWGGMIFRILAGLRHGGGRPQYDIIPLINREWPTSPDRLRPGPGCPETWSGNKNNPEKGRPSPPLYRSGIRQACSIYRISSIRTSAASPAAFIPSRRHDADDTRGQGPDCTPEAYAKHSAGFAAGPDWFCRRHAGSSRISGYIQQPHSFPRRISPAYSVSRRFRKPPVGGFRTVYAVRHKGARRWTETVARCSKRRSFRDANGTGRLIRSHFSLCIQLSIAATSAQRKAGSPHPSSICRW